MTPAEREALVSRLRGSRPPQFGPDSLTRVIAVTSGKGGVGKSSVTANLAVALAARGLRVGLLDADVFGFSIPGLLGIPDAKPTPVGDLMMPPTAHGVAVISIGMFVPGNQPVVWRGPMLHKAIQQLFTDVAWSELDYLIVDLPPGTGDAQLSLAQSVPLTGGVIVTGPQAVSVSDALRGAKAFERLEVPIIGVVENMSGDIFGSGGGMDAAKQLHVDFLARIPLDARVRAGGDSGEPIVLLAPESDTAKAFRDFARVVAAKISMLVVAPEPKLRIV